MAVEVVLGRRSSSETAIGSSRRRGLGGPSMMMDSWRARMVTEGDASRFLQNLAQHLAIRTRGDGIGAWLSRCIVTGTRLRCFGGGRDWSARWRSLRDDPSPSACCCPPMREWWLGRCPAGQSCWPSPGTPKQSASTPCGWQIILAYLTTRYVLGTDPWAPGSAGQCWRPWRRRPPGSVSVPSCPARVP